MFSLLKSIFRRQPETDTVLKPGRVSPALSQSKAEDFPGDDEVPAATGAGNGESIHLPMKTVINCLPQNLQAQLRRPPGRAAHLILPISSVLPQLCRGRVRVTFKEIKTQGPPETFLSTVSHDAELIDLPLQEILARIKPEHLARRPGQRRVQIPDDVISPFGPGSKMRGAVRIVSPSAVTTPPASASLAPVVEPEAEPAPVPPVSHPLINSTPTTEPPAPAAASETPAEIPAPIFSMASPATAAPIPPEPVRIVPMTPLPARDRQPDAVPVATERPAVPIISPIATEPVVPAAPAPVSDPNQCLSIEVERVVGAWAAPIQAAVRRVAPEGCLIRVPLAEVETKIKQGKVAFTWAQIRGWLNTQLSNPLVEHETDTVELPLAVVAPLFMAHRKVPDSRTRPDSHAAIPDVFAGSSRKPAGGVSPAPIAVNSNLPTETAGGTTRNDGDESGAAPAALVNLVCKLPGVGGAVIATRDGLLVARQLPAEVPADPIAAFLPQMFQRLTEYVAEMKMGCPTQFTFVSEGRVFAVHKTHDNYLIILGRLGENLPEAPIKALITRLNQPRVNKH